MRPIRRPGGRRGLGAATEKSLSCVAEIEQNYATLVAQINYDHRNDPESAAAQSARNGAALERGVKVAATHVGYRLGEAAATTLRVASMTTAALSYELTAAAARLTWARDDATAVKDHRVSTSSAVADQAIAAAAYDRALAEVTGARDLEQQLAALDADFIRDSAARDVRAVSAPGTFFSRAHDSAIELIRTAAQEHDMPQDVRLALPPTALQLHIVFENLSTHTLRHPRTFSVNCPRRMAPSVKQVIISNPFHVRALRVLATPVFRLLRPKSELLRLAVLISKNPMSAVRADYS
jgi:hypothetical protein